MAEAKLVRRRRLKTLGPVAGTALGLGYGDNLYLAWKIPENDEKWLPAQHHTTRPVQVTNTHLGISSQGAECISKFRIKGQRRGLASRPVPCKRPISLSLCFGVDLSGPHPRCFAGIRASIRASMSSSGAISTAPESISLSRRLISPSHAASISAAEAVSGSSRRF
jgi:hypothetical protein